MKWWLQEQKIVLATVGVVWAAPGSGTPNTDTLVVAPTPAFAHLTAQAVLPVTYISRYHAQDELGQVNYGFTHPGQSKNEIRDALGNVAGIYTYIDNDNKPIHVEYTAGVDGFQVKSNALPVGYIASQTPEPIAILPEDAPTELNDAETYNAASVPASTGPEVSPQDNTPIALEPAMDTNLEAMDAVDVAATPDDTVAIRAAFNLGDTAVTDEAKEEKLDTTQPETISDESSAVFNEAPLETTEDNPVVDDTVNASQDAVDVAATPDDTVAIRAAFDLGDTAVTDEAKEEKLDTTQPETISDESSAVFNEAPLETTEDNPVVDDTVNASQDPQVTDTDNTVPSVDEMHPVEAVATEPVDEVKDLEATSAPIDPENEVAPDDAVGEMIDEDPQTAQQTIEDVEPNQTPLAFEESPLVPEHASIAVEDFEVAAPRTDSQDATAATPDVGIDSSLTQHFGYISALQGVLPPLYTYNFPYRAYGTHAPAVLPLSVATPSRVFSEVPVVPQARLPYYHYIHNNNLNYVVPYARQVIQYIPA
ncbi:dextranase-like isoform X2 [Cherax quadricarinatus]|uniref:dextranase-like isoform X2 n=1 Tax=Cherax quadricarinatus TaxID=27406 RepID=UPI00387E3132